MNRPQFIKEKLDRMAARCREDGLPVTVQRRMIMESLAGRVDHPTADQVYEEIRERIAGVSRTTVYRVLEAFVAHGLAQKVSVAQAKARFDAETRRHHHLECVTCGGVVDIHDKSLDEVTFTDIAGTDFEIIDFAISFRGRCPACMKAAGTN